MTKKNILWMSLIGTSIFSFLLFLVLNDSCGNYYEFCKSTFVLTTNLLFIFPVIFLFSLITYKMRESTFRSWLHFSYWWVSISVLLVLIIPNGQGGGYMPSLLDKESVAFIMSFFYSVISLILITYKSIKLRGKK